MGAECGLPSYQHTIFDDGNSWQGAIFDYERTFFRITGDGADERGGWKLYA